MRAPWSLDNVTIPAQGLSHEVGISGAKLFVTVANNIIVGGASTTVEVLPNGSTQNLKIGYGTVMTFPINAEWVLITGTGANVSVRLSSIPMPLTVNVVSVSSISGTVNTDVGQGGQKSGNTTLNFGGTPVDPRDRNWTLGNGDVPSRGWSLGSGDTPSRSWALGSGDVPVIQGETPTAGTYKPVQTDANGNLLRGWSLGATDVPGRGWSLGSGDQPDITANQSKALGTSTLPVYIRPLNSGDTPARSWGLGSNDNPDITVNQANPLGSSTKPVYIRGLNSSDTPKPIGSNGGGFTQDTSNNLQHVPVLQGTSTPIHTKAAQYDSNNYPLHTLGNVLAGGNGGDTLLPSSTYLTNLTQDFSGNISSSKVPTGYKWSIDVAGIGVIGEGTTINSASLQFYMPGNLLGGTGTNNTWFFTAFTDSTSRSPTATNEYGFYWFLPNWPTSISTPNLGDEKSGIEWNVAYYWSNTGPATGDTTYLTKQLVLYPGATPTIYINATVPSGDSLSVWLILLGEQVPL